MWQKLYADNKDRDFMVVTVAMDSPEAAGPWIEAINPTYPCLIDRDHRVAELYNMVNVPQAVWIDETGLIVRPAENAGSSDAFRFMNRETKQMTPEKIGEREAMKSNYVAAIGDWIENGAESEHALDASAVRSRVRLPDDNIAFAHAHFRLGRYLRRGGQLEQAAMHLSKASELHPNSWNIWRQAAEKDETGLAVGPEFWARVEALGDRPYHLPIDMKGVLWNIALGVNTTGAGSLSSVRAAPPQLDLQDPEVLVINTGSSIFNFSPPRHFRIAAVVDRSSWKLRAGRDYPKNESAPLIVYSPWGTIEFLKNGSRRLSAVCREASLRGRLGAGWSDVKQEVRDALQGHGENGVSAQYGTGVYRKTLDEAMKKVHYDDLDLAHLI